MCGRCKHPYPLHGNGTTECKAIGCKAGPDGGPCPEWVPAEQTEPIAS